MAGLAPPSPAGPPQPIEHVRGDVLALLSDRAKAVVIGQGLDYITKAQELGESPHTLMRLRGLLRRMTRAMYLYEVAEADDTRPQLDIDTTRW